MAVKNSALSFADGIRSWQIISNERTEIKILPLVGQSDTEIFLEPDEMYAGSNSKEHDALYSIAVVL